MMLNGSITTVYLGYTNWEIDQITAMIQRLVRSSENNDVDDINGIELQPLVSLTLYYALI